ncbi:MAG: TatD family hydrolase [Candidatus Roizmanbacteria bacterium]|nr:MAG: TatD family hydrolase [Candidatus Roizmanbacteria bacterium]
MFDTHCHLNFDAFKNKIDEVLIQAKTSGVDYILIPGTDIVSSRKAVEIAGEHEGVYAAVGIHPHHIYEFQISNFKFQINLEELEQSLKNDRVVAVGEVGIDRHSYGKTKYSDYEVDEKFIDLQKELFKKQLDLAIKYDKSLIIHNREAKEDVLKILKEKWDPKLEGKTVFHCCEPDGELLKFAVEHKIYIGVDGDITYSKEKQSFIKKIPLDQLVLETDAPFLLPEPLRTQKKYPNTPSNLLLIGKFIADIIKVDFDKLTKITVENSLRLFNLDFNHVKGGIFA